MKKRWVFETLVRDNKDNIGLIAYALYKNKKHILATSLRKEGKEENYIQNQVQIFHDQTLQNNSIEEFRERAKNYLDEMIQKIEAEVITKYDKEKLQLLKKHQTDLKNEKNKLIKSITSYQQANKPWYERLFAWLISGVPGIASSFLITCLLLGASVLLVSEEKRQEVFKELAAKYLGLTELE